MNLQIQLATTDDIPALQQLIRESVATLSANYYTSGQIASALSHVFGVDTQLILDGTYFVAKVEDQIVGCGGWSKRHTLFGGDQLKPGSGEIDVDLLLDPARDAARIRAFYIHPHWSRKGIGSQILTACEEAASAAGFARVELVATLPGEPFYLSRGYEKGEAMQLETPDGESLPAFRMTKSL
jgi:N-acetylglutamate synthase-like GNAT family acetyltransferase